MAWWHGILHYGGRRHWEQITPKTTLATVQLVSSKHLIADHIAFPQYFSPSVKLLLCLTVQSVGVLCLRPWTECGLQYGLSVRYNLLLVGLQDRRWTGTGGGTPLRIFIKTGHHTGNIIIHSAPAPAMFCTPVCLHY